MTDQLVIPRHDS